MTDARFSTPCAAGCAEPSAFGRSRRMAETERTGSALTPSQPIVPRPCPCEQSQTRLSDRTSVAKLPRIHNRKLEPLTRSERPLRWNGIIGTTTVEGAAEIRREHRMLSPGAVRRTAEWVWDLRSVLRPGSVPISNRRVSQLRSALAIAARVSFTSASQSSADSIQRSPVPAVATTPPGMRSGSGQFCSAWVR